MKSSSLIGLKEKDINKMVEDAHLGFYVKNEDEMVNLLDVVPEFIEENPELYYTHIMMQPENFWLICKEILNIDLHQFQVVILEQLWNHKFPMLVGCRGMGKSFILAVYCLLRILLLRNRKVVVCGSGFRQSKIIFQYMENIVNNSKILKQIITEDDIKHDNGGFVMTCKDSTCTAIPIGAGNTIRGLRANDVIGDEFASIPLEIFETVIAGFASVSSSPTEQAKNVARKKMSKLVGFLPEEDNLSSMGNQIIISGTAYYSFNHFAQYHEKWKRFIKSRGNISKIADILGDNYKDFNYEDYCIIRMPVELIPEGFMDASQIARARVTVHNGIFQMEYGAVFSSDSTGFISRRLIESCVVPDDVDSTILQSNNNVLNYRDFFFTPKLKGDKNKKYIMGIDPAISIDNFSIVIIELTETHRNVVYCWTTNKKDHVARIKSGNTQETNYYSYCARKIRNLMGRFNISYIALDAQGGGYQVMEALNDENLLNPGEIKIWPIIGTDKFQDSDAMSGLHIIDVVQFVREEWTRDSNHGLKKDMEDKVLLFPYFDAVSLLELELDDEYSPEDNEDKLSKVTMEIEELKNELSTIVVTETATGRQHFDTPEIKTAQGKKGRLRKDRYSALLMANMTARTFERELKLDITTGVGGTANNPYAKANVPSGAFYTGNQEIARKLSDLHR
jgi:hypothetical protein